MALPTDDRLQISAHTGRCREFAVYIIANQDAALEGYRTNTMQHGPGHEKHEGGRHHDHGDLIALLQDCDLVLAGGMGPRLIQDFEVNGISIVFTFERDIAAAVNALAEGRLVEDQPRSRCARH